MSPNEVMGDIHQKATKCLKKDVRAVLLHCANVRRMRQGGHHLSSLPLPAPSGCGDRLLVLPQHDLGLQPEVLLAGGEHVQEEVVFATESLESW